MQIKVINAFFVLYNSIMVYLLLLNLSRRTKENKGSLQRKNGYFEYITKQSDRSTDI